ncbi:MAG: class I SAM-dependent RNA methyltransferase [Opitutaceae bacterium]|nr:class I SAM-dependent RNA methyltransferase [Opitutaceae bacterium]
MAKTKFNDRPFAYHQELELEITTLTNLGVGLGRIQLETGDRRREAGLPDPADQAAGGPALRNPAERGEGWVVLVPFALPGERVRARVFRNHQNYSEADLVEVLTPSPHRVVPRCALFGRCGGCQYQNLAYAEQLQWKQRQVRELLQHMAGIEFEVAPVIASPREFGYRSKITPHFPAPKGRARPLGAPPSDGRPSGPSLPDFPIGFLKQGTRHEIIDVPRCEIATAAINQKLTEVRAEIGAKMAAGAYPRGATLLLREASGVVTTDYDAVITEEIPVAGLGEAGPSFVKATEEPATGASRLQLKFLARDFFQNNPFILPAFAGYVRDQAAAGGARFLIDAYCGSGLFALAAAAKFERVAGVEISETSIRFARENAAANGMANASFLAGDATAIFVGLDFPPGDTVVVIDPPRKGCDESFLRQLFAFGPQAVVYVSCDPATQMRDLTRFLAAGYKLAAVQPFDLFPQTRHLECVMTLRRETTG